MDAVWDGRLDGPRDEAGIVGFVDQSTGQGNFVCANVGSPILTGRESTRPVPKLLWAILLKL